MLHAGELAEVLRLGKMSAVVVRSCVPAAEGVGAEHYAVDKGRSLIVAIEMVMHVVDLEVKILGAVVA